MNKLRSIIRQAIDNLSPRQKYAADVIRGKRLWSGADLQGKARKYEFESLFDQFLKATHPWHEEFLLAEASAVLREIGEIQ